jgi:hypothetical protein
MEKVVSVYVLSGGKHTTSNLYCDLFVAETSNIYLYVPHSIVRSLLFQIVTTVKHLYIRVVFLHDFFHTNKGKGRNNRNIDMRDLRKKGITE